MTQSFYQKIYLIRHGATEWTATGQHTGKTDIPLSEEGCCQAKALKEVLKPYSFFKVFSSPLKRALETCTLSGFSKEMEIWPDLMEWDYGSYEGMTHAEIKKADPTWSIFTKGAPQGESLGDIGARVNKVLIKLRSLQKDVALFSHGHFLRVLAARWLSLSPSEGKLFALSPASFSILGYERKNPVVLSWNNTLPSSFS